MVTMSIPSIGTVGNAVLNSSTTTPTTTSSAVSPRNDAIENGLRRATAQQQDYLNEAKALYEPYRQAGASSLDEYIKLLLGGVDGLSNDRNFQDMRNLTERQVMANRAVSGLLRSGATASALNDSLLRFSNSYYDNRLKELQGGIQYGTYGTDAQTSILEKLGVSGTDLAEALANIQMQRESNDAMIKAAREQAGATTSAAKKAGESQLLGSAIGALGTVGMAAMMFSDRRLKRDLKLVGKSHNGLNIYLGRYTEESGLDDGKWHLFLIAQEVQDVVPDAVVEDESGYLKVDYAKALEG